MWTNISTEEGYWLRYLLVISVKFRVAYSMRSIIIIMTLTCSNYAGRKLFIPKMKDLAVPYCIYTRPNIHSHICTCVL